MGLVDVGLVGLEGGLGLADRGPGAGLGRLGPLDRGHGRVHLFSGDETLRHHAVQYVCLPLFRAVEIKKR